MSEIYIAEDGKARCAWCQATPQYVAYHENEWGYPVIDDQRLFEKICLEGFQSGLSWLTILVKRENFRAAFANFDFNLVAKFTDDDVERLMLNAGIVRHRGKITATIDSSITGYAVVDYVLGARQGQYMNVSMATDNGANYFNILAPGENQVALFNGSISENQYEGILPDSGDYTVRIYMMRSAARRNEIAQLSTGNDHHRRLSC